MNQSRSIRISIILTSLTIIVTIFTGISSMLSLNPFPLVSYYIIIALTIASLIAALISLSSIRREKREVFEEELVLGEAQEADIEKRLELEKQELDRQRLDLEKDRVNYVLERANKMVDTLHPDIDQRQKEAIVNALIPNLLQLTEANAVELTPQQEQNEV